MFLKVQIYSLVFILCVMLFNRRVYHFKDAESLLQEAGDDDVSQEGHYAQSGQYGYDVDMTPPWFVVMTTAFQHTVLCIGNVVTIMVVISDSVCADINDPVRSLLFSSSFMCMGLATALQSLLGLRLPIFQGPSNSFLIPIFAMRSSDAWTCPQIDTVNNTSNVTLATTLTLDTSEIVDTRLAEIQGSLVAASVFEVLIGITGLIGILMRFISPIVIGVTVFCLGYSLYPIAIMLCRPHWGIGVASAAVMILVSEYMSHIKVPMPRWNKKSEQKRNTFPVFQVFPIIITMAIMWITCAVCTQLNVFSDDPRNPTYHARTDVRNGIIRDTPWFLVPYPGQFGWPRFNSAIFIGFFISVVTSIIESVGDYIATSHICKAYPVPRHALNRGITVEGIFSVLSGFYGVGHATTSYCTTISLLGITKIHSRVVLVVAGCIAIILSILGKFGAVMATVPDPVLGGIFLAMIGVLCSVGISSFQSIDLRSSRNISIIGVCIFVAIVMSEWQRQYPDSLKTDSEQLNQAVTVTIGNAMFVGFVLSLIMDNTVRGSDQERGVNRNSLSRDSQMTPRSKLYDIPFIGRLQRHCRILRHMPFLQPYVTSEDPV